MASSKKLLVNADDLGLSSAINKGIIQSHLTGIVTSTSIVASGTAFTEGVQLAKECPTLGVGVHLTLVEENSVAEPDAIPTLAPNGVLPHSYGDLMKKVLTARISLSEIEREFRAQIEKCLRSGIKLSHVDSHQHTHALPLIFPIALRLANDYAIPGIRIPRAWPRFRDLSANRSFGKCALCVLAHTDGLLFHRGDCKSTKGFVGLFESGALNEIALLSILDNLAEGTTELVCHPGCADPSPRYASWNKRRQLELASLTSDSARAAIRRNNIQLINYSQL
jgi:predicted glycoside hydrolase/deacetylase ChbG (UPF0249 family)